ncbi:MAG: MtnX-like HAD-IB family phosphatase [Endomicrobiaceae bacterium]|nr:MtnX-like HAD-IB family phosphatase [Endomicrobiaceae bacterium]
MKNKKIVLISDFDGTITKEDFFNMVVDKLLSKDALKPWYEYIDGKITHIEALTGIFSQIHLSEKDMDEFISKMEVDKYFYDTMDLCLKYKIPVYVCSAGTKYYIEKKMGETLKRYNISLVSNDAVYSQEKGLRLIAPEKTNPFYDENTGISKEFLVKKLNADGYFTIYAGDGRPDLLPAKTANIVFAKSVLLDMCKQENIKTEKFENFKDILDYIRRLYAAN